MSTHSSANSTHTNRSASHSLAQSLASLRHSASGGGGSKHRLKPASSITRQENRLGITTDYVDLSLHSAAAKGNVGESSSSQTDSPPICIQSARDRLSHRTGSARGHTSSLGRIYGSPSRDPNGLGRETARLSDTEPRSRPQSTLTLEPSR